MKRISRRKFLSLLTQGAGSAAVFQFLESCGLKPAAPGSPTGTPFNPLPSGVEGGLSIAGAPGSTDAALPSDKSAPTAEAATGTPSPTAADFAYLAVARGGDDPEALTRAAVAAIGGMGRFVPKGSYVLIKPNMCVVEDYSYAATTNPLVVGTLVKMAFEAGASKVLVFDFPFGGLSTDAARASGIADQVAAAGGQMEYVDLSKFKTMNMPNGHSMHSAKFYTEVIQADIVINVPIAKHHRDAGLTLGMKNMMGTISSHDRQYQVHADLHRRIADLADFVRPELTVIDAMHILIANGPQGGSLSDVREIDTVIASADVVAADAYATKLFVGTDPSNSFYKQIASDPNKLGYVKYGAEWGIGRSDLENLTIAEVNVG